MKYIWHLDMGLGFAGEGFFVVDEDEYEVQQQQGQEQLMAEDAAISTRDSGSAMGGGVVVID